MFSKQAKDKFVWMFELATVTALQILIMASVAVATVILFVLFIEDFVPSAHQVQSVDGLLPGMQKVFAGVLVVLLGLELSETIKAYFADHHIKVEVILVVAIVAVGRHMIQLDFEHVTGTKILGLSALMLSLTGGYFIVRRAQASTPASSNASPAPESQVVPEYKKV